MSESDKERLDRVTLDVPSDVSGGDPLIGRILDGRYELRALLGAGGMGAVYRAYQRSLKREVAIKVMHGRGGDDVERFMREAELASRLSHPNIVVVHDFGHSHDGLLFLVMELVGGRSLRQVLREDGPLDHAQLRSVAGQLCDALAAAHAMGVVHRDLKPANVMLSGERVTVLDFGLAKHLSGAVPALTQKGAPIGTPVYMSPEMIRGEPVDARSDLYSLGCTLYELAAGKPPFGGASVHSIFDGHIDSAAPVLERRDLGNLPRVIDLLLAKRPGDRPASAEAVKALLDAGTVPSANEKPSRLPLAIIVGACFVAALIIFVTLRRGEANDTTTERTRAAAIVDAGLVAAARDAGVRRFVPDDRDPGRVVATVDAGGNDGVTRLRPAPPTRTSTALTFDPRRFDPSRFLFAAQRLAHQVAADARLTRIDAEGVRSDGRADLTVAGTSVEYRFRSPARTRRRATQPDLPCEVSVTVAATGVTAELSSGLDCDAPLRPAPRCSFAQVWDKAQRVLGVRPDQPGKLYYLRNGWHVYVGGKDPEQVLVDDCR